MLESTSSLAQSKRFEYHVTGYEQAQQRREMLPIPKNSSEPHMRTSRVGMLAQRFQGSYAPPSHVPMPAEQPEVKEIPKMHPPRAEMPAGHSRNLTTCQMH